MVICDRPNFDQCEAHAKLANLRFNIGGLLFLVPGPASRIERPRKDFAHITVPVCKAECRGSYDSSLGGEKIIFVTLYTHMRCLQVMYIISHVCVEDLG